MGNEATGKGNEDIVTASPTSDQLLLTHWKVSEFKYSNFLLESP